VQAARSPHRGDRGPGPTREKFTLRQLLAYLAGARGHFTTAGTPEQIADLIEDWFNDGAADGFNLMPPLLPSMLDVFVAEVDPAAAEDAGCSAPAIKAGRCGTISALPRPVAAAS
jgi:alkanesulfonate monooxygenase SsuD/methylene tetrahydromethanopterin reductase-like flavin-dependent oxidoreductase (luciferase family)